MEDLKNLEFLAVNSKEIIEKQVDSYRQQHSYAGTIIGATALFIPFFLNSLDSTFIWIQLTYLSIRTKLIKYTELISKFLTCKASLYLQFAQSSASCLGTVSS